MTATVGSRDDLADDWLNTGSLKTAPAPGATSYPKRSELRRAEARAAGRRGGDRRPPSSRPPNGAAGRHGPPAPAVPGRSAETARRSHGGSASAPWLPIAVAPSAAVLPIRQTSTRTRPAGISLPVPPAASADAFHQAPTGGAPLPLAVPAADGVLAPPMAPPGLAAPVTPTVDPAEWGLDIEAAPATGRRRGAEDDTAPGLRRPGAAPGVALPARLFGRGKAGAARMLVLALVVGAEGVAVTSMAGHARSVPADPSTATISNAYELAALAPSALPASTVLDGSAERQQAAVAAQAEAADQAQAQTASSKAKVTSALQQAKAAADRVKAAADRRERAMRNAQKDPKSVARIMAADRGWGASQFSCLTSLWNRESMWRYNASNPSSGAYGIPQSLPGSKMASAGSDWRTNPVTQIKWGLNYIADRYGTPCGAWGHSESVGWY